jgi:hypothetical protein
MVFEQWPRLNGERRSKEADALTRYFIFERHLDYSLSLDAMLTYLRTIGYLDIMRHRMGERPFCIEDNTELVQNPMDATKLLCPKCGRSPYRSSGEVQWKQDAQDSTTCPFCHVRMPCAELSQHMELCPTAILAGGNNNV